MLPSTKKLFAQVGALTSQLNALSADVRLISRERANEARERDRKDIEECFPKPPKRYVRTHCGVPIGEPVVLHPFGMPIAVIGDPGRVVRFKERLQAASLNVTFEVGQRVKNHIAFRFYESMFCAHGPSFSSLTGLRLRAYGIVIPRPAIFRGGYATQFQNPGGKPWLYILCDDKQVRRTTADNLVHL